MADHGFFHKLRISIFGAVTPKRWFRESAEMSVEEVLDPRQSDVRDVVPEEPHATHSERAAGEPPEHVIRK